MSSSTPDEALREAARREGEHLLRLQNALRDKHLVIVVGAGVTLSATADVFGRPLPRLTWTGLIRNGLDYLVTDGYGEASTQRIEEAYAALEYSDPNNLLHAAGILKEQLVQQRQFPTWLRTVFGSLCDQVRHPAVLEALKALRERGAKLLTTNYDDLLEKFCGLPRIGRSNQDDVLKFKGRDLDGIFHVHGSYQDPHEVVLDTRDYYQVRTSDEVQSTLRVFLEHYTILFVGCGSGLEDPNFEGLLEWASERQKSIPNKHCLLVRNGDALNYAPLVRLKYGDNYKDLAPYLNKLLDGPSQLENVQEYNSAGESSPSAYTQEEKDCLQSLSFIDLGTRQHTIATALSKTSTWIFDRPEFVDWVERRNISEHKGLLWIKGKPGSGKSVMMKHIQTQISQPPSAIINFFFNARGGPLEKIPLGLFRSLLHQLLQQQRHLLSKFLPIYQAKRDTLQPGWKWQKEELRDYLANVVKTAQVPSMTIFVDALDECEEENVRRVVSFFAKLTSSAVSSECRLNVCMSSRHYPSISVPGCLEIFMEHFNTLDISTYVESELWLQSQQGVNFQKEVADKASGVFLWVVLVVELLLQKQDEGATVNEMRQILRSVPDELDRLFTQYFNTINAKDRRKTLNLMQWILFAERPLTPMEINCALAFSVESPPKSQKSWEESDGYLDNARIEKVLRALSKGLVEITKGNPAGSDSEDSIPERIQGSRRVQFIHESVREFLLHHDGLQLIDSGLGQSAIGKSHDQLTKACVGYLSIEELQIDLSADIYVKDYDERYHAADAVVNSYGKYVFWDYTVRSLFKHASKAENEGTEQRHLAQIFHWDRQSLFRSWRYFSDCLGTTEHIGTQGPDTVFLHVASESGLATCVSDLLGWRVDVNIRGGNFIYALAAAASKGREATARLLLEKGAGVDAQAKYGGTALYWAAARYGHEAIARLLLERGADVNAQNNYGATALHHAAENGHETTTRLLLEKGANVNTQDNSGKTTLHYTAKHGYETIARLLLEKKTNVNAQDKDGEIALYQAIKHGHETITRLLLEKGSDINAQNESGKTALHYAAENGHETIARLLLEKGANVNAQKESGETALHHVAENGHETITRLLLEKRADVNAQNESGETALHHTATNGHETIARLLLEKGADVSAQAKYGETALHQAAGHGHEIIARLLLEKGANVNAQDNFQKTALHRAVKNGHEAIVRLLLEKRINVNAQDKSGETALHCATNNEHEAITRLLLEKGVDVNTQNKSGKTALYRAVKTGHELITWLLLDKGADVNMQANYGKTALYQAARNGYEVITQLLLEKGADVNLQINGETVLYRAIKNRHEVITHLLLEKGADVNARTNDGETALYQAAGNGHEAITHLLLKKGADVNVLIDGETALYWATENGHEAIARLLLEKGADVNVQGNEETALH